MNGRLISYVARHHWGLIATAIALTGTAYAADLIGPRDIARNAVRGKHVQRASLNGSDIRNDSLRGVDIVESSLALPAGPTGPAGVTGPAGPTGPGGATGPSGSPDSGDDILTKLAPEDGAGSGLDADLLDGLNSSALVRGSGLVFTNTVLPGGHGGNPNSLSGDVISAPGLGTVRFTCGSTGAFFDFYNDNFNGAHVVQERAGGISGFDLLDNTATLPVTPTSNPNAVIYRVIFRHGFLAPDSAVFEASAIADATQCYLRGSVIVSP